MPPPPTGAPPVHSRCTLITKTASTPTEENGGGGGGLCGSTTRRMLTGHGDRGGAEGVKGPAAVSSLPKNRELGEEAIPVIPVLEAPRQRPEWHSVG